MGRGTTSYSDFENRLPRGRSYARNGCIVDLQIKTGKIEAIVSGSEIYRVTINIRTLPPLVWRRIKQDCSQSIDSLIDLLQGRFSEGVMGRLTRPEGGLFPKPAEIDIKCTCPDWAYLCKHAAAVLYGVGARLDSAPEMLFTLRKVDHLELISQAVAAENLDQTLAGRADGSLTGTDLGEVFGIDLDTGGSEAASLPAKTTKSTSKRGAAAAKKTAKKQASTRKQTTGRSASRRTGTSGPATHSGAGQ